MKQVTKRGGLLLLTAMAAAACTGGEETCDETWVEAYDASAQGWLLSVWGSAADDLYAVGGTPAPGGAAGTGRVMHYDGSAWATVDLGMTVPVLNWVHGFGANDITMVGEEGSVIHFDGTTWSIQTTTTAQELWGVWGAAADDLWAVGGNGRMPGQASILHYDGTAWTGATGVPELQRENVFAYFKVWGTSASDVYVVGQRGVVLHYDGSAWTELDVGATGDLISLWGTGPNEVIAVGGRGNGQVAAWNGTEWRQNSLSPLPGLNGIWMQQSGTAFVAGEAGTLGVLDVATLQVESTPISTNRDFHAVFGVGESLTAVGGDFLSSAEPFNGIAYERCLASE